VSGVLPTWLGVFLLPIWWAVLAIGWLWELPSRLRHWWRARTCALGLTHLRVCPSCRRAGVADATCRILGCLPAELIAGVWQCPRCHKVLPAPVTPPGEPPGPAPPNAHDITDGQLNDDGEAGNDLASRITKTTARIARLNQETSMTAAAFSLKLGKPNARLTPTSTKPPAKLSASVPWVVSIALSWARNHVPKLAAFLNTKVDIPGVDEQTEEIILETTLGTALDAIQAALNGQSVITVISKRDTTRAAILLFRDHVHEIMGDIETHLPSWAMPLEAWSADEIVDLIDTRVLPWIDGTPKLQ
jgi:hypothetical protein